MRAALCFFSSFSRRATVGFVHHDSNIEELGAWSRMIARDMYIDLYTYSLSLSLNINIVMVMLYYTSTPPSIKLCFFFCHSINEINPLIDGFTLLY